MFLLLLKYKQTSLTIVRKSRNSDVITKKKTKKNKLNQNQQNTRPSLNNKFFETNTCFRVVRFIARTFPQIKTKKEKTFTDDEYSLDIFHTDTTSYTLTEYGA